MKSRSNALRKPFPIFTVVALDPFEESCLATQDVYMELVVSRIVALRTSWKLVSRGCIVDIPSKDGLDIIQLI